MRILAIDTTSRFLSLAVYDYGRVAEYNLDTGSKLSSLLVPSIKRVLDVLKLDIGDIDYFAVGVGPGSFTGIRLGFSTVKGFSLALRKPVIGIPTLDALAMNATVSDKEIITAIDAKRGLVYSCVYTNKEGRLIKNTPYLLLKVEELLKKIKRPAVILGDALKLYHNEIVKNAPGIVFLENDLWYPKARNIISLALKKLKGTKPDASIRLKPIYLYPKECQIREARKEKLKRG